MEIDNIGIGFAAGCKISGGIDNVYLGTMQDII